MAKEKSTISATLGHEYEDLDERAIEAQLSKALAKEHFHLEQLTSGLKYPSSIVEAVNQKNKAIQEAQRALNEVAVKKAEAEKMLVQARAEREANELKTASLTPAILKKMWIEKWNGEIPQVITGGNSNTFLDISKLK